MVDRHPMWKDLSMDLETHDLLCDALPAAFGDVFLSQENRPEGMAFWDMVAADVHGIRPAELVDERGLPYDSFNPLPRQIDPKRDRYC